MIILQAIRTGKGEAEQNSSCFYVPSFWSLLWVVSIYHLSYKGSGLRVALLAHARVRAQDPMMVMGMGGNGFLLR